MRNIKNKIRSSFIEKGGYSLQMPGITEFFTSIKYLGIALTPAQKTILGTYYNGTSGNPEKHFDELVLLAGMRGGKTLLGAGIAAYEFLNLLRVQAIGSLSHYFFEKFGIPLGENQRIYISIIDCSGSTGSVSAIYQAFSNIVQSVSAFKIFKIDTNYTGMTCGNIYVENTFFGSYITAIGQTRNILIFDEFPRLSLSIPIKKIMEGYHSFVKSTITFSKCRKIITMGCPVYTDDCGMALLAGSNDVYASEINEEDITELYSKQEHSVPTRLGFNLTSFEMNPSIPETDPFIQEIKQRNYASFSRDFLARPLDPTPKEKVKIDDPNGEIL